MNAKLVNGPFNGQTQMVADPYPPFLEKKKAGKVYLYRRKFFFKNGELDRMEYHYYP